MTPMTPEQRGEVSFYLPPGQNPAAPELVAHVAAGARALEMVSRNDPSAAKLGRDMIAVVCRLLDAERQLAGARRVLGEACALADDLPDDGLTAGDIGRLAAAAGIDLADDIETAEVLRAAHATAGAW